MSINTHCHQFSPSFHAPAPISDKALTLTMYSTPASSPVRIVEFAGGETERRVELIHDFVSLVLYSTSYSVMGNSLWGVVQDTVRVTFPSSTDSVTDTLVTLGSVNGMLE